MSFRSKPPALDKDGLEAGIPRNRGRGLPWRRRWHCRSRLGELRLKGWKAPLFVFFFVFVCLCLSLFVPLFVCNFVSVRCAFVCLCAFVIAFVPLGFCSFMLLFTCTFVCLAFVCLVFVCLAFICLVFV